ncbi:MAG: hypothetical protein V7L07_06235 [Nostoc sp.]
MVILLDSDYASLIVSLATKFLVDTCTFFSKGAVQEDKFSLETGNRLLI